MADKETPKQTCKFESIERVVMVPITIRIEYRETVDADGVPCAKFEDADQDRTWDGLERTRREIGEEVGEETAEVVAALAEITKELREAHYQNLNDGAGIDKVSMGGRY